ncbi:PREDICTED: serine/threonine-protein phosphatase 6 regulatory ankyrin repeat subunit B-like [Amphimedon queenslandica]|uniref:Uncharacterized protein n=1 Tax=Amphimedon queenslandica TaxID=400682 RepID=A0A1X7T130_AMPQE|nr:PREDICTED: serine/threonine-protein phosphatase 6 regulatory ankyrin repeat subunit B-like [Amphimedon queenslandica]|eukprot:XP_019861898.1 PREDICTED: serine/threonine-protein phosphatase 6 regulatory ankyrin repeat subunit B-like [Amphimedon queenslandica]
MVPIHLACSNGRLNLIQYIIEHTPSSLELPDSKDSCTPFLIAVYFNQLEVIKYLISKKCSLLATDGKGAGAVHISVERGHLNVLKYLIDNNYCNPNATDHQDRTPLQVAVASNKYEILEYLLNKSIPSMSVVMLRDINCLLDSPNDIYNNPHNAVLINAQDKVGNTPLHVACQHGQQNMVLLLLKASLSKNNLLIPNKKGQTPLHLAVASGHKNTSEALLSSVTGSSTHHDLLTATDNDGSTVLHTACSNGHIDVFRYLSSIYPQGVNVMDNRGHGLLHAACEGGDIGIVRTLIETHGLDPLAEDEDGITCLHLLAERKRVYVYQYLEPNIVSNPVPKDKSGRTPLHYASCSDNIRMVRYLIETFPCSPDDPDNNGYTSVHGACEAGSMELVHYFLTDLKCNALAETDERKTMLYFASMSSNFELIRFLINVFSLKPRPHDIEVAQSVNPGSLVVKYLQRRYLTTKILKIFNIFHRKTK